MQHCKEILIVSGIDYVRIIEETVGHLLPIPPRGFYINGQIDPMIVEGFPYYSTSTLKASVPVEVMECQEDLYNEQGKLVVPAVIMRNKERYLTSTPQYNPTAFRVLEDFILSYFELVCPYNKSKFYQNKLLSHFAQDGSKLIEDGILNYYLDSLTLRLSTFMNGDYWREYSSIGKGYDFIISKEEDFRITDWMRTNSCK